VISEDLLFNPLHKARQRNAFFLPVNYTNFSKVNIYRGNSLLLRNFLLDKVQVITIKDVTHHMIFGNSKNNLPKVDVPIGERSD